MRISTTFDRSGHDRSDHDAPALLGVLALHGVWALLGVPALHGAVAGRASGT